MSENAFSQYVRILGKGRKAARSLNYQESLSAMGLILDDEVEAVQLGAFLMLLRVKEESSEELAGFAQAVRNRIPHNDLSIAELDWPSYAGKRENLHHYICSMILLADHGISVLCHGAQGHTANRVYTEDVFHELQLGIASDIESARTLCNETNGLCYLSLDNFCPKLNDMMKLRDLFGLRSPVHSFAKLINPGACPHIIIPTFHPSFKPVHQEACQLLNEKDIAVFKGDSGEAERRPQAILSVDRLKDGISFSEKWPALMEKAVNKQKPDLQMLLDIWRDKQKNIYSSQAIIGTTALALQLCHRSNTVQEATDMAHQLWEDRNKRLL